MRRRNDQEMTRSYSPELGASSQALMSANICSKTFSSFFYCSTCSTFMEEASICKSCLQLHCKTCIANFGLAVTKPKCHWCSFESLDCCWMPQIAATFKNLAGRQSLLGHELYSELAPIFACQICTRQYRKAHLCPSCSQPLCRRCFVKSLRGNPGCPLCRAPLRPDDTIPCDWIDKAVALLRNFRDQPSSEADQPTTEAEESDVDNEVVGNEFYELNPQLLFPLFFVRPENGMQFQRQFSHERAARTSIRFWNRWNWSEVPETCKGILAVMFVIACILGAAYVECRYMISARTDWQFYAAHLQKFNEERHHKKSAFEPKGPDPRSYYGICLNTELPALKVHFVKEIHSKALLRKLFDCLKKQQTTEDDSPPCFLLLAHTDNSKGRASVHRLVSEISIILGRCSRNLASSNSVQHLCLDHSPGKPSGTSCEVIRDLQTLSPKEFKLDQWVPSVRLVLFTIGLPDGYALTEGAALYRLQTLWNPEGSSAVERLLNGNVLPV